MIESILIDKCKAGDSRAFKQLIKGYHKQLLGYFGRYSSNQFDAEEMLQETLIKVWSGLKKYNEQKKFSSWLFTIAHNVAVDSVKQKRRIMVSLDKVRNKSSMSKPDEEIILNETVELINSSINNLSEKQKEVFLLRQHGDLQFKEISEIMNEPLNTVISHMHYAVKKIKRQLETENESRTKSVI